MAKTRLLPSLEYLHECFELSESSPSGLIWKLRPRSHFNTDRGYNQLGKGSEGKVAGSIFTQKSGRQYWSVQIGKQGCYCHRVIYSMFNNVEISVSLQVDHKDGNGLNNLPSNLRLAEAMQNSHNCKKSKANQSGYKGVGWNKTNQNWRGRIMRNGKLFYTKGYANPKDASLDLERLREILHKQFTNHG